MWRTPSFNWKAGPDESEANLLYVGVTRAKWKLSIPCSSKEAGVHIGTLMCMILMIDSVGRRQKNNEEVDYEHCADFLSRQNNMPAVHFYEILRNAQQIYETFFLRGPFGKLEMPVIGMK